MELAAICGTGLNKVTARTTENQMGLVATEAIEKGEIMIRVPLAVRAPTYLVQDELILAKQLSRSNNPFTAGKQP